MSLASVDSSAILEAKDCLAVLNETIGGRIPDPARRVLATSDARCPDEGLALLGAYVSIADRRVRQAILDAVLALGTAETGVIEAPGSASPRR